MFIDAVLLQVVRCHQEDESQQGTGAKGSEPMDEVGQLRLGTPPPEPLRSPVVAESRAHRVRRCVWRPLLACAAEHLSIPEPTGICQSCHLCLQLFIKRSSLSSPRSFARVPHALPHRVNSRRHLLWANALRRGRAAASSPCAVAWPCAVVPRPSGPSRTSCASRPSPP